MIRRASSVLVSGARLRAALAVVSVLLLVPAAPAALAASESAQIQAPVAGPGPWNLTIFHTNDFHSAFLPRPVSWRDDGRMVGGIVALAWHLADQRRTAPQSLLLDAGDFMTGNPVCLLEEDGVPGAAIARMMSAVGYDAGVMGNHEFDVGAELAARLAPRFGYPLFGGDIIDANGEPAYRREPIVFEKDGLRIGVFGFSCAGMTEVVTAAKLGGLRMAEQASLAREIAAQVDAETDLIVLITHNGVDGDKELARQLTGAGIDVIVGGHSHTRLRQPVLENGILIVQAGSAMTNLGRLDLQVADDRVVSYDGGLIDLWSDGTFGSDELNALVAGYENRVMTEYGRQIGILETDLRKGEGEHSLGNWLADCLRAAADADVALINSGGIRKPLQAGPITALDITELLPFANNLVRLELTGAQLAAIVQQNADAGVSGKHGILQVSGLKYAFRSTPDGQNAEVTEILVGGQPLDPGRTYLVAMPDFVTMMNDVYLKITLPEVEDLGVSLATVVIAAVEEAGNFTGRIEGRITRTD